MLSKWFTKFTNKIMELLYVNKVHGYLEIFQKILNSQIVSKTIKWIWKAEIEKTFGKNKNHSLFWAESGRTLFLSLL
jgi:hypothetical protein